MHENTDKFQKTYPVGVYSDLTMKCDDGSIYIKGYGGNAIFIHFSSLRSVFTFLIMIDKFDGFVNVLKTFDRSLKRIDVTLFWRSSNFPILGSNGKLFLLKALTVMLRIINLPSFGTSRFRSFF